MIVKNKPQISYYGVEIVTVSCSDGYFLAVHIAKSHSVLFSYGDFYRAGVLCRFSDCKYSPAAFCCVVRLEMDSF